MNEKQPNSAELSHDEILEKFMSYVTNREHFSRDWHWEIKVTFEGSSSLWEEKSRELKQALKMGGLPLFKATFITELLSKAHSHHNHIQPDMVADVIRFDPRVESIYRHQAINLPKLKEVL